ncbi:DUF5686 and carboxypeptidase regulatory-like domain-containing protein [Bacteroides sp. UBA939]|uniref:DUF5686 and carboxypeptidase regulatory-like domain-containing protein n=1 Tax=Bacteroides sp. UBA939 TaxID=1946092 RepID=UPI0025C1F0FE|nr:DUF5686 and carboxypeptidase regulatory-like domain-containing protein [Bacteroides sp. UBA939]
MKRVICLVILNSIIVLSFAQNFKGTIADDKGNPVPYAALYLKEMKSGLTTDENGRFLMKLPAGEYTCEVSSLGFMSQVFSFRMQQQDYEKNIILSERIYSLPEVNITKSKEDPAYAVMRQAIARASYYRNQVKGFKAGTYLKGTGKGTSIPAVLKVSKEVRDASKKWLGKLFVLEEQQAVTFTAPNTWNSRVIAYKNSFPDEVQIEMGITTVNLYTPELFGKISPLNKKAFSYYRFRLDACFVEAGQMINKIRVIPKREDPRLLEGDLFIVEDLWCVSAADVSVHGGGLKAKIKVTCKEVQPTVFLPVSTTMSSSFSLMGFKAEASYLAAVHYAEVKTGILPETETKEQSKATTKEPAKATTNEPPKLAADEPAKVTAKATAAARPQKRKYERPTPGIGRRDTEVDSLAGKRDSLYWTTVRSVPLRLEELQSYQYKEEKLPGFDVEQGKKLPKDSLDSKKLRKKKAGDEIINRIMLGKTFTTSNKKAWLTLPGLSSCIPEYNFVDGFWLGVKLKTGIKLSQASTLRFVPSFYYTIARKEWVGQGELTLDYAPRNRGHLSLSGGVLSADYNAESGESRLVNAVSSSLFGHNHVKFYENTYLTIAHSIEPANGLLFSSSLSWQRRKMLDNHVSRSWFKRDAEPNLPENKDFRKMPENDILKASFALEYTPAHYYHISRGRKVYEDSRYPTFTLKYDRAFPVDGKRYLTSYHLLQFSAKQEIEFGMFNRFVWTVNAGSFRNAKNLQFPDFKHFASTHTRVTERSFDTGFSLPHNYALSANTRWAQANVSWYTPRLLLKLLPFLSKKFFDESLHIRSVVAYKQHPYTELGYSAGLSDVARIGVFVGFDCLKYRSVGVSVSLPLSQFRGE